MGELIDKIKNYDRIALDTNLFIYLMERNNKYFKQIKELFNLIESGKVYAVTSTLMITEILTKPLKDNNFILANKYLAFVSGFPNIYIREVDYQISIKAAKIRAEYGLKTPDAIFLATAIKEKAQIFITNDINLNKVKEIDFIILDEYIK